MTGFLGNATGFLSLTTETLHDIASYVDDNPKDLSSFIRSCRTTATIGAYVRYTSIYVSQTQGQTLLATLLSGSPTSNRYTLLVKRVWLEGGLFEDMDVTVALFCQAVVYMDNLVSVVIAGDTIDTDQFMEGMKRNGLIRESRHPAYTLTAPEGSSKRFSLLTLPRLRSVRISADMRLLRLVNHRPLTELIIDDSLNETAWAEFMSMVDGTVLTSMLTNLSLKLGRTINIQLAMFMVSEAFPSLRVFAVQRGGFQLADLLITLGSNKPIFPTVRYLWVNAPYRYERLRGRTSFVEPQLSPRAIEMLFCNISDHHPSLEAVGLGMNMWTKGVLNNFVIRDKGDPQCSRIASKLGEQVHPGHFRRRSVTPGNSDLMSWGWSPM